MNSVVVQVREARFPRRGWYYVKEYPEGSLWWKAWFWLAQLYARLVHNYQKVLFRDRNEAETLADEFTEMIGQTLHIPIEYEEK
jgi:hypothetical protein